MSKEPCPPLSYSTSNEIMSCQQKFVYRKKDKVSVDHDACQDRLAMDIGSTLHKCLEDCLHDLTGFKISTLLKEMENHDVPEEHGPMLWAMLRNYKDLHEKVGLACHIAELRLQDVSFIGFVDIILIEPLSRKWWIADLKTASSVSKFLTARLPRDRQLNIYMDKVLKHVEENPELGLKVEDFAGCKYRVVTKAKLKRRDDDTFQSYSDRFYKSVKALEFTVKVEDLEPDKIMEDFDQVRKLQVQLMSGRKKPIRNYNSCDSYYRPCDYWSRCHATHYTDDPVVGEVRG